MAHQSLLQGRQQKRHQYQDRQQHYSQFHLPLLLRLVSLPQPRLQHQELSRYASQDLGDDTLREEYFEIRRIGLNETTFSVAIQISGYTNVWILNVAYLAVEPSFPHHFNTFDNVPINYTSGPLVQILQCRPTLHPNQIRFNILPNISITRNRLPVSYLTLSPSLSPPTSSCFSSPATGVWPQALVPQPTPSASTSTPPS